MRKYFETSNGNTIPVTIHDDSVNIGATGNITIAEFAELTQAILKIHKSHPSDCMCCGCLNPFTSDKFQNRLLDSSGLPRI